MIKDVLKYPLFRLVVERRDPGNELEQANTKCPPIDRGPYAVPISSASHCMEAPNFVGLSPQHAKVEDWPRNRRKKRTVACAEQKFRSQVVRGAHDALHFMVGIEFAVLVDARVDAAPIARVWPFFLD